MITSVQNPNIKRVRALRKSRERQLQSSFLIEGFRENLRYLEKGKPVEKLFFCTELFLGDSEPALIEQARQGGAEIIPCSQHVFEKISYRDRPDGLLSIAPLMDLSIESLKEVEQGFYVLAEAIEKPGNLGTMLRVCDAVGADGMIVADPCTDVHNPNVVRASVGTLFTNAIAVAENEESYRWAKQRGLQVVAATPHAELSYTEVDFTQPSVILLGTEQYGLSKFWLDRADVAASLPMKGAADSLNVAMAATVMMYEVVRQREAF